MLPAREPVAGRLFAAFSRLRLEGLRLKLAILLQQDFNFPFRLFEFLAAGLGKLHTFFKELQGALQRNISTLQFRENFFQTLETLFESWQRLPRELF